MVTLILSHHPARFGVHRPYGTNGVCSISSIGNDTANAISSIWSIGTFTSNSIPNSNSNDEVPMPRYKNGPSATFSEIKVLLRKRENFFSSDSVKFVNKCG